MEAKDPVSLRFAIADHPWVENADAAAVRIAMTVVDAGSNEGELATVVEEYEGKDGSSTVDLEEKSGLIHSDLKIGANLGSAVSLLANEGLSCPGVKLHGSGFIIEEMDLSYLGFNSKEGIQKYIRNYRNGRDLTNRPRGVHVIDLFGLSAEDVRERFPEVYQWVHDRVKPERDAKSHTKDGAAYAKLWWLFGKPRQALRKQIHGLSYYISTPVTSKHRFFEIMKSDILPDDALMNFAFDTPEIMGVLSSKAHVVWTYHLGSSLGPTPRYIKTRCFETFPFPELNESQKTEIGRIAEALDAHRKSRIEAHPELTMTGLYNVLEKIKVAAASSRSPEETQRQDAAATGSILTAKEKKIYELGLVGVLRELHDELDAAVFAAYGWPTDLDEQALLTRLVALNQRRAAEEAKGTIRYLRPEYQNPNAVETSEQTELETTPQVSALRPPPSSKQPWPKTVAEQAAAVRALIRQTGWTSEQDIQPIAQHFKGVRAPKVQAIADALIALGQAA